MAYREQRTLFGEADLAKRPGNVPIVNAFRDRLQSVAGFGYVPEPIPMRNSRRAVVYYLFFAAHRPVAAKIVKSIFKKHRDRMGG